VTDNIASHSTESRKTGPQSACVPPHPMRSKPLHFNHRMSLYFPYESQIYFTERCKQVDLLN